jgi:hypothetical protein
MSISPGRKGKGEKNVLSTFSLEDTEHIPLHLKMNTT